MACFHLILNGKTVMKLAIKFEKFVIDDLVVERFLIIYLSSRNNYSNVCVIVVLSSSSLRPHTFVEVCLTLSVCTVHVHVKIAK